MKVNDPGKLLLLAVALLGGFALAFQANLGDPPDAAGLAAGVGIVTGVIGYITGNGKLAQRGKAPEPAIRSNRQALPSDDVRRRLRSVLDELEDDDELELGLGDDRA